MSSSTLRLVRLPFDLLFRPSVIIEAPSTYQATSLQRKALVGGKLLLFFFANLLLYTFPLSLAGIGTVDAATTAPAWFASLTDALVANPDAIYRFLLRLAQNSLFLFVAALLTFGAVHVGVLITGQSNGILISLRIITYSTALYLATLFTLVWFTAISPSIVVADDLLLFVQAEFINAIIDWMGTDLVLPGDYPTTVNTDAMTLQGRIIIVAILITLVYYLYVIYRGVQIAHDTSQLVSLFVVGFVLVSPALYTVGSIVAVESTLGLPEGIFV